MIFHPEKIGAQNSRAYDQIWIFLKMTWIVSDPSLLPFMGFIFVDYPEMVHPERKTPFHLQPPTPVSLLLHKNTQTFKPQRVLDQLLSLFFWCPDPRGLTNPLVRSSSHFQYSLS